MTRDSKTAAPTFAIRERQEIPTRLDAQRFTRLDWGRVREVIDGGQAVTIPCHRSQVLSVKGLAFNRLGSIETHYCDEERALWVYRDRAPKE